MDDTTNEKQAETEATEAGESADEKTFKCRICEEDVEESERSKKDNTICKDCEEDEDAKKEDEGEKVVEGEGHVIPSGDGHIKVVLLNKGEQWNVGVQAPDCDPVFFTLTQASAPSVDSLIAQAKEQWAKSKRYPKANLPAPPPPARTTTTVSKPSKPAGPQQALF